MRPVRRAMLSLPILLGATMLAPAGCSSLGNRWSYNDPPTQASAQETGARDPWSRRVIVLGRFENPVRSPLRWRDIGPGLSDALAALLINGGEVDVLSDTRLSRNVRSILDSSLSRRSARLAQLTEDHPNVRYAVTGQVTDFYHSTDMPREAQRWGVFSRRKEAVVAIRLNVIDLQTGRLIAADHVRGTAPASDTPTRELYANIALGSLAFWNTPLGRAGEEALEAAAGMLKRTVPRADPRLRIVRQVGPRKVTVSADERESLIRGQEFFVCLHDPATDELSLVYDPDTGLPLQARIESARRGSATAWLRGLKPPDTDLRGAVLCRQRPPEAVTLAEHEAGQAEVDASPPPED
ncbi:MAG: CsgG/HfaB family protein [Planctomycetota bacterium]|nr:CsgG/HfaB family protein [Planctomycetota bacterium]